MNLGWQDVVVGLAAAAALAWFVRYRIRRRRAPGCDDCPAPDSAAGNGAERLIPASSIRVREPHRGGRR